MTQQTYSDRPINIGTSDNIIPQSNNNLNPNNGFNQPNPYVPQPVQSQ